MHCMLCIRFFLSFYLTLKLDDTDRPTDRQTDRPTDIVTYRAAIAAKNKHIPFSAHLQ